MGQRDENSVIGKFELQPLDIVCDYEPTEGDSPWVWVALIVGFPERVRGRTPSEAGLNLLDALRQRGVAGSGQIDGELCVRLMDESDA